MIVEIVSPESTYALRHSVLRPHQPLSACKYPGDHDDASLHIGILHEDDLISVGSFFSESSDAFTTARQYRIRGMATISEHRGAGAGSALISFAAEYLSKRDVGVLWCNARTTAADFYEKAGFAQHGSVFDLPPIGPHKVMYLTL